MIEQHIQRLLTTQGFIEAFWEMSSEYPGQQEKAYEAVESQHESNFGMRKFKTFESFRVTMYKYLNKKRDGKN